MKLILLFISAAVINNFVLSYFLGICPFIGVSNKIEQAFGMGLATTFVMTLAACVTWIIYHFILIRFGLPFLQYASFIIVIASLVQIVEMFIKYDLVSIPVVDSSDKLVGIAIIHDVVDEIVLPIWKRRFK